MRHEADEPPHYHQFARARDHAPDRGRQERNQPRADAAARLRDGDVIVHHAEQQAAIQPDHGQDGAELDEDLEGGGARAHERERVTRQNQMSGGRDGDKLRRALDQAEDDRGDDGLHQNGAEGIRTPDPLVANQVLSQLSYRPLVENRDGEARRVPSYLNTAPRLVVTPTNTRCGVSRHNPTLPPASTTIHSTGRTVTALNAPHSADSPAPAVNPYSSVVSP